MFLVLSTVTNTQGFDCIQLKNAAINWMNPTAKKKHTSDAFAYLTCGTT